MNYHYGREEHYEEGGPEWWEKHTAAEWQRLASQAAALNARIWDQSRRWIREPARFERLYKRGHERYFRRYAAMKLALEGEIEAEYNDDRNEVPEEYPF